MIDMECNCKEHYLELFHHFDEDASVYHRYCYKCGKWWWEYKWTKKKTNINLAPKIIHCQHIDIHHAAYTALKGDILCVYNGDGWAPKMYVVGVDGSIIQMLN